MNEEKLLFISIPFLGHFVAYSFYIVRIFNLHIDSCHFLMSVKIQITNNKKLQTWTEKNGPMMCTVVSSPAVDAWSGSLMMPPVIRCNSLTFWPPLPMMRPTCAEGTSSSIVSRTSSVPDTKPSSRIFSKIKYCAFHCASAVPGKQRRIA